jgi:hypothetical protein
MISFDTMQKISRDVASGISTTDSDVDYTNDENVQERAKMQSWFDGLPPGSEVVVPSEGVDATQDDVDAMKAWVASERAKIDAECEMREAMGFLEERYAPDQPRDEDGRFSTGAGSADRGDLYASPTLAAVGHASDLREPDGGFTLDPHTGNSPPGTGDGKGDGPYAVAVGGTHTMGPIDVSENRSMFQTNANGHSPMGDLITAFIADNADKLSEPGMHLGGWHDPESNKVYLDVTEVFPKGSLDAAMAAGTARNQIAITDLSTFKSIKTGGTGDTG